MIRDRGRIKWTAMMLPEHVKMLRDWSKEDVWEQRKELDEQKLEELDEVVQTALQYNQKVAIHYYIGKNYETAKGWIQSIDLVAKELKIKDTTSHVQLISLESIDDIHLADE